MNQRIRKLITLHKALYPRDDATDFMCRERKEEEDKPELKTVLMHRYSDLKTT